VTKGYQVLNNNFFYLSNTRGIKGVTQLLLIFLRGFYHYKREPVFFMTDKHIMSCLGITRKVLRRAKRELIKGGFIGYFAGKHEGMASVYTMYDTILAPKLSQRGPKCIKRGPSGYPLATHKRGPSGYTTSNKKASNYTSKGFSSLSQIIGEDFSTDLSRFSTDMEASTRVKRGLKR